MCKRVFGGLAALSFLLAVGTVAFWAWSTSHSGYVRLRHESSFLAVYPGPNCLTFTTWHEAPENFADGKPHPLAGSWPKSIGDYAYTVNRDGRKWSHVGIQYCELTHLDEGRSVLIPNGLFLAIFAPLPLAWIIRRERAGRSAPAGISPVPAAA